MLYRRRVGDILALMLVLLVAPGLFISCRQPAPEVKIGLSVNLSGRGGVAGEFIRDGAMLAVKEVNENGGINGRPLRLIVRDDENSEEGIRKADQALINEGVVAIFGHSYSSNTIIAYPLVTSRKVLLVTAYSASNSLSGKDDLFLRTSVDCALYGEKMAELLRRKGVENLSVLMDMSNAGYVLDYVEQIRRHYHGGLHEVHFLSRENADWGKLTDDLLVPAPQAVLLLTEASMTGIAAQKLRARDFRGGLLATIWTQTPSLFSYGGEAVEGMSLVTFISPENNRPAYHHFAARLQDEFNRPPTARSSRAYEVIMILADALKRCRDFTAFELKEKLLAKEYETLIGRVAFDRFGDVIRPVYEVVVSDGRFLSRGEI